MLPAEFSPVNARRDAIPWVPLPAIDSFDALMKFDAGACLIFRRFRRPAHPLDAPPGIAIDPRKFVVVVTTIEPGVRSRVFEPRKGTDEA